MTPWPGPSSSSCCRRSFDAWIRCVSACGRAPSGCISSSPRAVASMSCARSASIGWACSGRREDSSGLPLATSAYLCWLCGRSSPRGNCLAPWRRHSSAPATRAATAAAATATGASLSHCPAWGSGEGSAAAVWLAAGLCVRVSMGSLTATFSPAVKAAAAHGGSVGSTSEPSTILHGGSSSLGRGQRQRGCQAGRHAAAGAGRRRLSHGLQRACKGGGAPLGGDAAFHSSASEVAARGKNRAALRDCM